MELSEEAKILYFMNNLNDSIFGDVESNFMDISTRALFPQTYEELKQRMIAEYSQLMTRKPHVVMKIIRGEDTRRFGEASFKAEEEGCHICGIPGHFWKKCRHYNKKFSLEQNRNYFKRKNGENTNEARAVEPRTSGGITEARATSGSTGDEREARNPDRLVALPTEEEEAIPTLRLQRLTPIPNRRDEH